MASSRLKCIVHCVDCKRSELIRPLTDVRWDKIKDCTLKWIDLDGPEREAADNLVGRTGSTSTYHPDEDGYHESCYNAYTHKRRISDATARKEKCVEREPSPVKATAPKRASQRQTSKKRAENVLPRICIICRKSKWRKKHGGARSQEGLMQVSFHSTFVIK